jgi:predicted RNase H-like nuclease (RuvC/YqgF family)
MLLLNSTCSLRKLRNLCSRLNKRLGHSHGQITEKNLHISQLEEAVKHLGAKVESTTDEAERKSKDVAELHLKLNENYRLVAELSSDNLRFVLNVLVSKVEKIEEDSLDSIPSPSPSVKIQFIGGKVYLR